MENEKAILDQLIGSEDSGMMEVVDGTLMEESAPSITLVKHDYIEEESTDVYDDLAPVSLEETDQQQDAIDEVLDLKQRIAELEQEVKNLQGELRLMKRKIRTYDPNGEGFHQILEKNIIKILDGHSWRISRTMMKDSGGRSSSTIAQRRPCPGPASTRSRYSPEKKRTSEYLNSDEDRDNNDFSEIGVDDEYGDPSYSYEGNDSNMENVKPRVTSSVRAGTGKRGRPRKHPLANTGRRVVVVKKVDAQSPNHATDYGQDFHEDIVPDPAKAKNSKVVSAGDVSVILDDEDEVTKTDGRRHVRVRRSDPQHRPRIIQCSHCPKLFRDQHDVTRHERTHTGEKPFFCSVCGPNMRFTQTYHLQRHTNKYHLG